MKGTWNWNHYSGNTIFLIELHDVLYVPDISNTLSSIIEHGCQPDCLFVVKNGANTVGFPIFTLLTKTNKEITLDADIPFKDRHSHPYYTNIDLFQPKTDLFSTRALI